MNRLNFLLIAALIGLSACATVAGMGQDITNTANSAGSYLSSH